MSKLPDVIRNYISAYNNFDIADMLACLSDDIEFKNITNGEVNTHTHSKAEFETLANLGVSAFKSRTQTVTRSMTVSDITLIEIDYEAVVATDLPNGWKAGQELSFSGASAFELRGDKIIRIIDQS